ARQHADLRLPRRQAQRVGGELELQVGVLGAGRGDDRLELVLLGGELVEVRVGVGVFGIHLVEPRLRCEHAADALLDRMTHRLVGVELRLLRQEADLQPRHRRGFAFDVVVKARHDLQQRALARAIQAEHADLRAGKETERNVLEDLALGRNGLAHAVHRKYVLSHAGVLEGKGRDRRTRAPCRYCRCTANPGAFCYGGASPDAASHASPASLHVSVATAGQAMTVYALSTAVLAPLTLVLTGSWPRRRALCFGLALFAVGNALCALAPTFPVLLLGRVLMGIGAIFTPISPGIAVAMVEPAQRGRALALLQETARPARASDGEVAGVLGFARLAWVGVPFVLAGLATLRINARKPGLLEAA